MTRVRRSRRREMLACMRCHVSITHQEQFKSYQHLSSQLVVALDLKPRQTSRRGVISQTNSWSSPDQAQELIITLLYRHTRTHTHTHTHTQ